MEYYSVVKRNKFESVVMRWMNTLQSEIVREKYHILTYIYMEFRKIVLMNLFAGKGWRHRCREWACGHSRGRRGWEEWRR